MQPPIGHLTTHCALARTAAPRGARLGRLNDACAQADQATERAESVLARLSGAEQLLDRGDAVARALEGANGESLKRLESLVARTQDAAAMREAVAAVRPFARARRAERMVVALNEQEKINDAPRQYLNRLSDLMFVLARVLNRMDGGDDVYWKSERMAKAAA